MLYRWIAVFALLSTSSVPLLKERIWNPVLGVVFSTIIGVCEPSSEDELESSENSFELLD